MKKYFVVLAACVLFVCGVGFGADESDFYKGSYTPTGDYILSGGLIKDLPDPVEMPVDYKGVGFKAEKLSAVPEPGVHPRVIMSPSDIERMKKMVAMGDKAPRFFRIHLEALKRSVDWKIPQNYAYWGNPFGGDGKIAGWALLALLTDDQELGRKAAKATVDHALFMEPRVDILNTCEEAKYLKDASYDFVRTGLKFGPFTYIEAYYDGGKERVYELMDKYGVEIANTGDWTGAYYTLSWEYDYAYNFMTDQERDIVRRVISKSTYGKYDTGMSIPGQMYINNHMSSGANWIPMAMAIEGEEGYDERILPIAIWSLKNKLTYDLSSDGITYENTKGYIPMLAVLAAARRQGPDDPENLLKHSHLTARGFSNIQHARKLYNRFISRHRYRIGTPKLHEVKTGMDEPRYWRASGGSGSGGHYEFWYVLKYFYPDNEMIDFVYNAKNSDFNADMYEGKPGEQYGGKLHYSWFGLPALCMMTAADDTDYNKLDKLDMFEDLPKFWYDSERGMVSMRNGWDKDSMLVHMENRIDQYYSGHETAQHGDFQVWADGISWCPNLGAYRDVSYRAMVTVDGMAGVYAPVSGDWMTADDTEVAATSVAEMTTAYQWRKLSKLMHLDHPGLKQVPLKLEHFAKAAYLQDRFTELPYLPKTKEHYDGFAHLDYGPWHGETRGAERYGKWNDPMNFVFRTIHFARGEKPYLLVMDDLEKDGKKHQYDWRLPVLGDSYVYSINPATQNWHFERDTEGAIGTDILLALSDESIQRGSGGVWGGVYPIMKPRPKAGTPMLLVRVLWRNSNFPFPVPNVQRYWEYQMVSVPAYSENPEYKVLIFPHRFGDKLPVTMWSDDMGQLTVKLGENVDVYDFDKTDRKRTVFAMTRNGQKVTDSKALPAKPILLENGKWTVDQNRPKWRQPRVVVDKAVVRFEAPAVGAEIRYTLDGSEPGADSAVYTGSVVIDDSCVLKARTYQADWRCGGEKFSGVAEFEFVKRQPVAGKSRGGMAGGLVSKGYEIKTTIFDRKGFLDGDKNSLPDVDKYEPLVSSVSGGFDVPFMEGVEPGERMMKGFYSFDGYFEAKEAGIYYFEVASCGPVDFKVGGQQVILVDKQYGLSYKKRYGEVALGAGFHAIELVVCDTMLWKGDIELPYEISVAVKAPGDVDYAAVADEMLSCDSPIWLDGEFAGVDALEIKVNRASDDYKVYYELAGISDKTGAVGKFKKKKVSSKTNAIKLDKPGHYALKVKAYDGRKQVGPTIEKRLSVMDKYAGKDMVVLPGVVQSKFDRIALSPDQIPPQGLPGEFFDTEKLKPYASAVVQRMSSNDSTRKLVEYEGLLRIDRDGIYEFALHKGRDSSSQLVINGQVVVRQRVDLGATSGKIWLGRGLHDFKLQIAMGKAAVYVKSADDADFSVLGVAGLARAAGPDVSIDGAIVDKNNVEIFAPAKIALSSPVKGATIRYSVTGKKPKKVYDGPISVDKSVTLVTELVMGKKAIGAVRAVEISRSELPIDGLVAYIDCEKIDDGLTEVKFGKDATAAVHLGVVEEGKKGNAFGFYEEASRISLRNLPTHEDAATISAWVKFKEIGDIYVVTSEPSTEQYDFMIRKGSLRTEFKRNIGMINARIDIKEMAPGKWFHVAASFGQENSVYLNGELVESVQVFNKNMRRGSARAYDLEVMHSRGRGTNAALDEFRIYNRVLSAAEIKALYEADK